MGPVAQAIKNGMTLEEAQKSITYEKEFPELVKNTPMPGVVAMNVGAIYQYLKNREKQPGLR
jgi:hypothetical protein